MPLCASALENRLTMTLRSWKVISSVVTCPSVPTISRRNTAGSVTRRV